MKTLYRSLTLGAVLLATNYVRRKDSIVAQKISSFNVTRSITLAAILLSGTYAKAQDKIVDNAPVSVTKTQEIYSAEDYSERFLKIDDQVEYGSDSKSDEKLQLALVTPDIAKKSLSSLERTSDLVVRMGEDSIAQPIEDLNVYRLPDVVVYADKETQRDWFGWAKRTGGAVEGFGTELFRGWDEHVDRSGFHVDKYRYESDEFYREEVDEGMERRLKHGMKSYLRGVRNDALDNWQWYSNKKDRARRVEDKHLTLKYNGYADDDMKFELKPRLSGATAGVSFDVQNFLGGAIESGAYVSGEEAILGDSEDVVEAEIKYVRPINRLPFAGALQGATFEIGAETNLEEQEVRVVVGWTW